MADGKLGSFLNFFKIDDPDDDELDEVYDDFDDDEEEEIIPKKKFGRTAPNTNTYEEEEAPKPKSLRSAKPKVVPMHSTAKGMEVNIIKPTSFEDSQDICNMLLSARPVVVNLEGFDPDDAQRIMDFISGCIYAINGKFHQISKYIFIFTPENVDISGDSLGMDNDNFGSVPTINREF